MDFTINEFHFLFGHRQMLQKDRRIVFCLNLTLQICCVAFVSRRFFAMMRNGGWRALRSYEMATPAPCQPSIKLVR